MPNLSLAIPFANNAAFVAVLCAGVVACTLQQPSQTAPGPTGSSGGVGADGGADAQPTASGSLACVAVLQCIVDCPDADKACPDACLARGTPEGQTNAVAFVQCLAAEKCTDEACVLAKCKPSMEACVTSSAPKSTGQPLQGAAPPGDVPAELVGVWSNNDHGDTRRLTLNADGTGIWYRGLASNNSGCVQLNRLTESGNAVVTADKITLYATDVKRLQEFCASQSIPSTGSPVTEVFQWVRQDATTIKIVDASCAAKYPDSPSSASLYCSVPLAKE